VRLRRLVGASVRPLNFTVRRLLAVPSPYVIAYFAAGAMGLVYLVLLHLLFERLESRHASTWQALGCPEFFSNLRFETGLRVVRFLARRDYLELNDPVATWLGLGASVLLLVVVLVCGYLQVVFYWNGYRWPASV
jgi:hypothetical protein